MNPETGKWIIAIGLLLVLGGILIFFFHDKFNWIGRLPGDIRVERDNFRFYFPITTLIIVSVLLSALLQLLKRFLK